MFTILALALALTAQATPASQTSPAAPQSIEMPDGARLEILYQAGLVRVRVGSAKTLTYVSSLPVLVSRSARVLEIKLRNPKQVDAGELTVTVPPGTNVKIDGWFPSVDVSGAVGSLQIHTREGAVSVAGGAAGALVRTVNGDVSIANTRGAVTVDSTAGAISLAGLTGDVRATGTRGRVTITDARMTTLDVSMISSDIEFEGALAATGRYTIASHTGDVSIALPLKTDATVSFVTLRGRPIVTPPLTGTQNNASPTEMRRHTYRIGGGAVELEVRTFSGNLRLRWDGAK